MDHDHNSIPRDDRQKERKERNLRCKRGKKREILGGPAEGGPADLGPAEGGPARSGGGRSGVLRVKGSGSRISGVEG